MDINNIPKTRINNVEQQNVSQTPKAKDTEFQAEKGRDLLGVQGDSRHILFRGNPTTTIQSSLNITRFQLKKLDKTHNQEIIEFKNNLCSKLFEKLVLISDSNPSLKARIDELMQDINDGLSDSEAYNEKARIVKRYLDIMDENDIKLNDEEIEFYKENLIREEEPNNDHYDIITQILNTQTFTNSNLNLVSMLCSYGFLQGEARELAKKFTGDECCTLVETNSNIKSSDKKEIFKHKENLYALADYDLIDKLDKISNVRHRAELLRIFLTEGPEQFAVSATNFMDEVESLDAEFDKNEQLQKYTDKETLKELELSADDFAKLKHYLSLLPTEEDKSYARYGISSKFSLTKDEIKFLLSMNRDEVSSVLGEKNSDNSFIHNTNIARYLLQSMMVDKENSIKLARMKDKNNKPRFQYYNIDEINALRKNNPDLVDKYVNMKDSSGEYRFDTYYLISILKLAITNPNSIDSIVERKNSDGTYRFNSQEVATISEVLAKYEPNNKEKSDFFMTLIDQKIENGDYRFSGYDFCRLKNFIDEDFEAIKKYANDKNSDGSYRFKSSGELKSIMDFLNECPRQYKEIVNMQNPDGTYRFSDFDFMYFADTINQYPNEFGKLVYLKDNNGFYRFSRNDLTSISTARLNREPEQFQKLLDAKTPDGSFKFNGNNINKLFEIKESFPDKFAELMTSDKLDSKIVDALDDKNVDYAIKLLNDQRDLQIPQNKLACLIKNYGEISYKDLQKLRHAIGKEKIEELTDKDLIIACKFADLHGKNNINEIPIQEKRNILKKLVSSNADLFNAGDDIKKMFPMLPTSKNEYCTLLPALVRSIGIETNTLATSQVEEFNTSMFNLSDSLAELSDSEFVDLDIKQEYSKDDFIKTVLKKVKDLPRSERQKVYDYYGFELHHNKENETGFSITGYPVNLNNGKKMAQITDPKTKEVVESLRSDVIKFSEQNTITCNNEQVAQLLNKVVAHLPELRPQIGKKQHETHDFDVLQHSLKVMQKVVQNPKFKTLNKSDQKIMLLATLLHDITKREGCTDKTHASEGSFDSFFIAKKFNLTKEEEIKLYTLARHHEWLEYANTAKSEHQQTKRLQSVAYDLRHDNLFDMALMFTHADLKAVKTDDTFHDTTQGKSRVGFDGSVRSFGNSADIYAEKIKGYIQELQKSQPLLPVTQIPTANRIEQAITQVNPDGSTNIKGVYKDKDGLVVIKYNEVEDWEAIGFPKGSVSRGITVEKGNNSGDGKTTENIDTGNIKFFVHGLDYENQLTKFDAFSLVDSDALLSISYAERPESKYRFFRAQGVILDFDTKYIHGGGETDAGSGCGKSIADFKKDYIFGGNREKDRLYVSNLIKNVTGMNDEEYVKFLEQNENKPFSEIEPKELAEKIIQSLATINSNTRKGNREYNEMYGSNPNKVMGVFAYNLDYNENIGNPIEFLNRTTINENERHTFGNETPKSASERTEFLRRYALEHNIPFIVFGD